MLKDPDDLDEDEFGQEFAKKAKMLGSAAASVHKPTGQKHELSFTKPLSGCQEYAHALTSDDLPTLSTHAERSLVVPIADSHFGRYVKIHGLRGNSSRVQPGDLLQQDGNLLTQ